MKTKLTLTLITLAGLIVFAGSAAAALEGRVNPHYKGASAFNLAGAGPNVARCGAFPENIELSFTGQGIDTEGGLNTAVFTACTNTTTNEVFDLKATDTYVGTGDQVFIEGDSFVQAIDPANCTATTAHGRYFAIKLKPGKHLAHMTDDQKGYAIDMGPGQTYYFLIGLEMGMWKGQGKITLDDRERAVAEIKKLKFLGQDKIKAPALIVEISPK